MVKIANGRSCFYQWEMKQQLQLDIDCGEVHFENGTLSVGLAMKVKEVDGVRVCDVPDEMLQCAAPLHAFAWDTEKTHVVAYAVFSVLPKQKPSDYVYTKSEAVTVEKVVEDALKAAKERGDFKGDPGAPGKDGNPGAPGKDGHNPVRGEDYWTEEDKAEIKSYINSLTVEATDDGTGVVTLSVISLLDASEVSF